MPSYEPIYKPTPLIVRLVAEISEAMGRLSVITEKESAPRLRPENRIRTIAASLAIENNTLTVEQVTAIVDGKRLFGSPREIQEVRCALEAYERMTSWNPCSVDHLLQAHGILMAGLVDNPGRFRRGGVGVFRADGSVAHLAPPAGRVPELVRDLLSWLEHTDAHALITSSAVHYELEFIHPFSDGNGRLGRLWQTVILSRWRALFAHIPVETVIHDRQAEYYRALAESDQAGDATGFIEFVLKALKTAIEELQATDPVSDYVSDQVKRLLEVLAKGQASATEIMISLGLSHRPTFRRNYLAPALSQGLVDKTQPDSPTSPTQRYRLTAAGRNLVSLQRSSPNLA